MEKMYSLTPNAISTMLDVERASKQGFIVQVSHLKYIREQKYIKAHLKDANTSITAIFDVTTPKRDLNKVGILCGERKTYLIAITEHITHCFQGNKILEILSFLPLPPKQLKPLPDFLQATQSDHQPEKAKAELSSSAEVMPPTTSQKKESIVIDYNSMKQFQRISDLYADFQGWQILVRVMDTSYKEFNSKSGKLTKIFTMTLLDRSGVKIEATMFGEEGLQYYNRIHENEVYKISRGQVKENIYNQGKDTLQSKYIIILTKNSEISKVEDIEFIPRAAHSAATIPQLQEEMNLDKHYHVICILVGLGEERAIEKEDGKTIYKRSMVVGDPEAKKSMEVIIWGRNVAVCQDSLGKAVLLKHFRLNIYRDVLSLCSTFKSQITRKPSHKYSQYQGCKIQYNSISTRSKETQKESEATIYQFIRDIQNELNYINGHEAIISDLQFWITFINFKNKWYYGACNNPKCKKQADHHSKCLHCGTYNEEILQKYILPIEITDFTGSLWTTAFDDFAHQIFKQCKIEDLTKLSQAQLKEQGERRLFQQFRGRICTKRSEEGVIRHTIIGKPSEVNVQKVMQANILKIKNALF